MARCLHGFEPAGIAGVKCPVGCHGPVEEDQAVEETPQALANQRARSITNQQIIEAIERHGSLNGAARELKLDPNTITNRSRRCVAVREALGRRTRGAGRPKRPGTAESRKAAANG